MLDSSPIHIVNSGDIWVETSGEDADADGIKAVADGENSDVDVSNSGDIWVKTSGENADVDGIYAHANGSNSETDVDVSNSGDIWIETRGNSADTDGIDADSDGDYSPVDVANSGDIWVKTLGENSDVDGINADTDGDNSILTVHNSGDIRIKTTGDNSGVEGFEADTDGVGSRIKIVNSGDIWVETRGYNADTDGIDTDADADNSRTEIHNSGDITVRSFGDGYTSAYGAITDAVGIDAITGTMPPPGYGPVYGLNSPIKIVNSGDLDVQSRGDDVYTYGIEAITWGDKSRIEIYNSGDIHAEAKGQSVAMSIDAYTYGVNSPIDVHNSGSVFAAGGTRNVGVSAFSTYNNPTTIWNTGSIGAESHLAIDVKGAGTAHIFNAGLITGFVDLTDQDDVFTNQSGGVFEAKKTSFFGAGDDLFYNMSGGTVQAATDGKKSEKTFFEGLETFKNDGLISMVDGKEGDAFTISNTPGGTDLVYKAYSGATLSVDTFLGGAGSKSDTFTIEGDVSGKTDVVVNNTNTGPGVFNSKGIPVVFVNGATPNAGAFFLDQPIDTGFFDYDLFFTPTGSGFWELRSAPGAGAHLLPQLTTAAQDIFFTTSDTWFDRTADLRVLLAGGAAPPAYDPGDKSLGGAGPSNFTPAVWVRGSGTWSEYEDSATTSAYGRTSRYDLTRDLTVFDFEMGVDFGKRAVFSGNDMLVFGILGGVVGASLDYDALIRQFHFAGGEIGAYATYLNGGLFVDTLVKVDFLEIETRTLGFPNTIDATTWGVRTDAGYRFGGFGGGVFFEPLATIAVAWSDLDGFSLGGNTVSFDDEANVRGRVGLRVGTSSQVWSGVTMEPFVIGSLWGTLSGDNSATLVSTGKSFSFSDEPPDAWGQVSAGVNFFNPSANTSVFAKLDVNFGDDLTGIGGRAGIRVKW